MMTDLETTTTDILALMRDRGFQTEAAQIQAKSLLAEITDPIPDYRWSYIPKRVVRNITFATFELQNLALAKAGITPALSAAARRLALIWESLAKLQEATTRETALLNAAIDYDLAGYQANSLCLARRLGQENIEDSFSLSELGALFLQRRFLQVLQIASSYRNQPAPDDAIDETLIEQLAYATVVRAYARAVLFFLSGERSALSDSIRLFSNAERLYAGLADVLQANVTRATRCLIPVMEMRSTWTLLAGAHPNQPKWSRYLKLLARGMGSDILRSRSVSELSYLT
jgi:hypothetical protein